MWLKWIGGIFVLFGCSGLGIWYRIRFFTRLKILRELERGILVLRGEVSYGKTPLPQAFEQIAERTTGIVSQFFQRMAVLLHEGTMDYETLWNRSVFEFFGEREMKEEDRNELLQMGKTMGYLDVDMQVKSLDLYQNRLHVSMDMLEQDKEKCTKLYPVLGTMCGAFLCIIML